MVFNADKHRRSPTAPFREHETDLTPPRAIPSAIFESPFHLRPPMPERNLLISPPRSPPEQIDEESPNDVPLAEDLQRALEQLRVRQARPGGLGKGSRGDASGDMSESEDGILLIPEGEAGVCCGCRTSATAVALLWLVAPKAGMRLMGSWATASGSCPVMYLLFSLGEVWDSSLLPRVCHLSYNHLLSVQMDIVEG